MKTTHDSDARDSLMSSPMVTFMRYSLLCETGRSSDEIHDQMPAAAAAAAAAAAGSISVPERSAQLPLERVPRTFCTRVFAVPGSSASKARSHRSLHPSKEKRTSTKTRVQKENERGARPVRRR